MLVSRVFFAMVAVLPTVVAAPPALGQTRQVAAVDEDTVKAHIESQRWDADEQGFKITAPSELEKWLRQHATPGEAGR